ncbi:MAG: SCO6745 family protein [Frankiaceae bacterium]
MADNSVAARGVWVLLEAVHSVTYFSAQARSAHEAVGLHGFWRGYFAMRAAPLGPVGAGVVTALFSGFAPRMVARAVPEVWSMAAPEVALQARQRGAVAALQTHAAPLPDPVELASAVQALHRVVAELDPAGRALGAANAELPWPDDPSAALWQAATALREYRGDGHVAVLTAHGVSGCQSHVLRDAADGSRSLTQAARGFTDDEWTAATVALQDRQLLGPDGGLTADGQRLRHEIETRTDQLCAPPWRVLSGEEITGLHRVLGPLATRLARGPVPYPNPVGAPAPPGRG